MNWTQQLGNVLLRFRAQLNLSSVTGITDLALDHAKRAQSTLWGLKEWSPLLKRAALTVSDRVATLPSDFGRLIQGGVYEDSDGTGHPDYYYTLNGDYQTGYRWANEFDANTSAFVWKIEFHTAPSNPYVAYIQVLPELTGSSSYLFFPQELLLSQMKLHYLEDRNKPDSNAYQVAQNSFWRELQNFVNMTQYQNVSLRQEIRGPYGEPVSQPGYNIDDGEIPGGNLHLDPDEHPKVGY